MGRGGGDTQDLNVKRGSFAVIVKTSLQRMIAENNVTVRTPEMRQ